MEKIPIRFRVPRSLTGVRGDALVVARLSSDQGHDVRALSAYGRGVEAALPRLKALSEVGSIDQTMLESAAFERLAVVSLGQPADFDLEAIRRAGAAVTKWATGLSLRRIGVVIESIAGGTGELTVQPWCEGMILATFRAGQHQRKEAGSPPPLAVDLLAADAKGRRLTTAKAEHGKVVAEAANLARALAHEPANIIDPRSLAVRARGVARQHGLRCRVLEPGRLREQKMGALMAVGQGSANPPRLIVLEHKGAGRGRPVVLVGKAITFDTGGYSLKPPDSMVGMKFDKCGGLAVLTTMQAIAALKLKAPVAGIIAAAENMVSDRAYRPNDIIRSMSGKTIEVISTDAEGRLVLADALTYAQREYQPRALIDLATLTGGARVALGTACAALMGNDNELCEALIAAGERTHERLWRLPLWDDYRELIKSDDADIKNSGGREAHAITGGIFLKEFVEAGVPWAHVDIAAVADTAKENVYGPKGATGFGVRLVVDYLSHL